MDTSPDCVVTMGAVRAGDSLKKTWPVVRLGYRVPRLRFDGVAHSVFDRACNVACGDSLLTLSATRSDGPTMLVIGAATEPEFRRIFDRGDAIRCRGGVIELRGATVDLRRATVWRAPARRRSLGVRDLNARLLVARARLAQVQDAQPSVIGTTTLTTELERACRTLDGADLVRCAGRLIGWGEGLTPAGDDYLVGLRAALGALAQGDARRIAFLRACDALLASAPSRTTPISAHYLRLAAVGDFNADLLAAVDALLCEHDIDEASRAIDAALAVGATSGADALAGIVSGFAAWAECPSPLHGGNA